MKAWAMFMAGTGVGAAARLLLSAHPWGILSANIIGCFVIGAVHARGLSAEQRLLVMSGFCGALTTLSGLVLEGAVLWQAGRFWGAAAYAFGSLAAGVLAFAAGQRL